ncbi:MAG: tetratricopeptide repeat protein [Anaerolineae bacterium]|nr:tetratricopeptide repeat protein [Anaerolineae bacterium]
MAAPNTTDPAILTPSKSADEQRAAKEQALASLRSWQQFWKLTQIVAVIIYAIAILIALPLLLSTYGSHTLAQGTPVPTLAPATGSAGNAPATQDDVERLIAWAERVSQSAAEATSGANTVLGAIQALGVLITGVTVIVAIAVGVASFAGYRRVTDLERDLTERAKTLISESDERADVFEARVDKRADALEARLNAQVSQLEALLQKLAPYESKLETFNQQADQVQRMERTFTDTFQGLVQQSKDSLEALNLLQIGLKEFNNRNKVLAIRQLTKAYEVSPDHQAVTYILGELLTRSDEQGDLERGIAILEIALQRDPNNPSVNAALGYAHRLLGDRAGSDLGLPEPTRIEKRDNFYDKALGYYEKVIHERVLYDITGDSAFGGLAGLYKRRGRPGDLETAIYWYTRIADMTPGRSYPLNNLALLHDEAGNYDKSLEVFNASMRIAQRNLQANQYDQWSCFDLITASTALNASNDAEFYLSHAIRLTPTKGDVSKLRDGLNGLREVAEREELRQAIIQRIVEWTNNL